RIARHPGSCLGAAYVAGYAVGVFKDFAGVSAYVEAGRRFEPESARVQLYDVVYGHYRETYERLKTLYPRLRPGRKHRVSPGWGSPVCLRDVARSSRAAATASVRRSPPRSRPPAHAWS